MTANAAGFANIYVDGFLEAGGQLGFFGHVFNIDSVWLGRVQFRNPSRHFEGDIDDLAIWGNELTKSEIQALANLPPPLTTVAASSNGPSLASDSLATASFPSGAFGTFGLAADEIVIRPGENPIVIRLP